MAQLSLPGWAMPHHLSRISAISAGRDVCLGLHQDGSVSALKALDQPIRLRVPSSVDGDIVAVSATGSVMLALRADGRVLAWAYPGIADEQSEPHEIALPPAFNLGILAIAGAEESVFAIDAAGRILEWDGKGVRPIEPGGPGRRYLAISAAFHQAVALSTDGRAVSWGAYYAGQSASAPAVRIDTDRALADPIPRPAAEPVGGSRARPCGLGSMLLLIVVLPATLRSRRRPLRPGPRSR